MGAVVSTNTVSVHLNNYCNFKCTYCYMQHIQEPKKEIKISAITSYLDNNTPEEIILYGGEPLLSQGIINFLLENYQSKFKLITNGSLLHTFKEIDKINSVLLSLDHHVYDICKLSRPMTKRQHNRILDFILSNPTKVCVLVTVSNKSKNLDSYFYWLKDNGIAFEVNMAFLEEGFERSNLRNFLKENPLFTKTLLEKIASNFNDLEPKNRLHVNGKINKCFFPVSTIKENINIECVCCPARRFCDVTNEFLQVRNLYWKTGKLDNGCNRLKWMVNHGCR